MDVIDVIKKVLLICFIGAYWIFPDPFPGPIDDIIVTIVATTMASNRKRLHG